MIKTPAGGLGGPVSGDALRTKDHKYGVSQHNNKKRETGKKQRVVGRRINGE
jgi:hypothetical protein